MEWVAEKLWGNSISIEKNAPFNKLNHAPHTIKQCITQLKKYLMNSGMKIILGYYNEAILNPSHFWWNKNCLQKYMQLPLPSQYILSLLLFMLRNKNQFLLNSEVYHIDTRQHANFHQPSVNLTKYPKGVYYIGIKVFNKLPTYIKIESDNSKKFKLVLQKFLNENSFSSLDEYFELQKS
jgi:hypothetical protein